MEQTVSDTDVTTIRREKLRAIERAVSHGYTALRKIREAQAKRNAIQDILQAEVTDWKTKSIKWLEEACLAGEWKSLIAETPLTQTNLLLALEDLEVLKWRLRDQDDDTLSTDDREMMRVRSWLDIWSAWLISEGRGHGRGDYEYEESIAFPSKLKQTLRIAIEWSVKQQDEVLKSLVVRTAAIIENRYDNQHVPPHVRSVDAWHIGWAMLVIAWLLADVVGRVIPCNELRLCNLAEAQLARRIYQEAGVVECPRCQSDITPRHARKTGRTSFQSVSAECESCEMVVLFPDQALPESVWNGPALKMSPKVETAHQDQSAGGVPGAPESSYDIAVVCALHSPELEKLLNTGTEEWIELPVQPDDPQTYHVSHYATSGGQRLRVVAGAPSPQSSAWFGVMLCSR
jgi:hypothetical protein